MESFLCQIEGVWQPHAGQKEFLLNSAKIKVLACGRRWGKTEVCAIQVLYALSQDSPTKHLILAPTADQARILFERVVDLAEKIFNQKPKVRTTPYPKLTLGAHTVVARSGYLGRSLRGNEATSIVVDEAAYLPEELITEVAMPMLATTNGALTLISTPSGLNHFWRFFQMGQRGEHDIWSRRAPSAESPFVSKEFLQVQKELISERAFRVEYEADFLDSNGQVFRTEALDACVLARLPSGLEGPFYIGVDWAKYHDYTAVVVLSGNRGEAFLCHAEHFHGESWATQVERVAAIVRQYPKARVLCDATGVGDPALEMLRDQLPSAWIEGLVFTSQAKSEMVDGLAWLIERGALRMEPNPELMRELQHFEATTSSSGVVKLGARGGYHDDLVMALALAVRQLPRQYHPIIALGPQRQFRRHLEERGSNG